jgi:hypothetical protein
VDLNHEFADELSDDVPLELMKSTDARDKLTKKLTKTIAEYEHLLEKDAFKDQQERNNTRKLLRSLKAQLEHHMSTKGQGKPIVESIEERREKALQEIFSFYARQHIPPGLPFEKLEETLQTINIGELLVFCKDFGIQIPRNELMLIYKKESENNMPHKLTQFKQVLRKLSELQHGKKISEIMVKIKQIRHATGDKTEKPTETGSHKSSEAESDGEGSKSDSEHSKKNEEKSEGKKEDGNDFINGVYLTE